MGIMDFLSKKKGIRNFMPEPEEQEKEVIKTDEVVQKPQFVADIAMFELKNFDWSEFGSELKQNKILSNSYNKKPSNIEIILDENNRPMVKLTFESSTSDSIREFNLMQDGATQYINGALDNNGQDKNLIDLWNKCQEEIRHRSKFKINHEEYFNNQEGRRLMKVAKKKVGLTDVYGKEQEFLEQYNDIQFDDFRYQKIDTPYMFIPLIKNLNGAYVEGPGVMPSTPKAMELCIRNLTNGCKYELGCHDEAWLEQKLREIMKYSCFDSANWENVIEFGKKHIQEKHREYKENEQESEM